MVTDGFESLAGGDDGFSGHPEISSGTTGPASTGFIDPESADEANYVRDEFGNIKYSEKTGKPIRKRGRRSGGDTQGATKSNSKSARNLKAVDTLSQTLLIVHLGLANITKFDGMNLDKSESDALANSLANVMEQFDYVPDPKFTAVAGLVVTSATIYGPRVYLYREDKKEKAEKRKATKQAEREQLEQQMDPSNIHPFNPNNMGGFSV